MTSARTTSYRRNRDYSKSFKWTYELDKDLFACYEKAKLDPRIGYMNRLKTNWDEKHPELANFSAKNLRDHVSSIIKRRVVMETDYNSQIESLEENVMNHSNDVSAINNNFESEISESLNIEEHETPEICVIKDNIRELLKTNFNKTLEINLEDRQMNTKVNKKVHQNVITAINSIAKEIIESIDKPSYHDLDSLIYAVAITCKSYNQDVQKQPPEATKQPLRKINTFKTY